MTDCLLQGILISLRALRVFKEMPRELVKSVTACDLSEFSRSLFFKNLELNSLTSDNISYNLGDTNGYLYNSQFDVVDIDPYGSMVPFIYSAIRALGSRGGPGLLCVTCTDTKVLMGPDKHKCYYDYGASRGGADCLEESALRIALYALSRAASMQMKSIKVLLAVHSDFYIRLFVEVGVGKKNCWQTVEQHGCLLTCQSCGAQWANQFGHFEGAKLIFDSPKGGSPCRLCGGEVTLSWLIRRTSLARFSIRRIICEIFGFRT